MRGPVNFRIARLDAVATTRLSVRRRGTRNNGTGQARLRQAGQLKWNGDRPAFGKRGLSPSI